MNPEPDDDPVPPDPDHDDDEAGSSGVEEPEGPYKIMVSGIQARIKNERIEYLGEDGKLVTESYKDFSKKEVRKEFASLNDFLLTWNAADKKLAIIELLEEHGVFWKTWPK